MEVARLVFMSGKNYLVKIPNVTSREFLRGRRVVKSFEGGPSYPKNPEASRKSVSHES